MKALHLAMIAGLTATAACSQPKKEPAAASHDGMSMDSNQMKGMSGMSMDSGGMQGMSGMMPMMQGHMDSMMAMKPEQMRAMMAGHEGMMSQMMDQMGSEMRQMKMSETPEWSALSDSVRQDLTELPGLKGQALTKRMQAHAERVRRLMGLHEQMMKS